MLTIEMNNGTVHEVQNSPDEVELDIQAAYKNVSLLELTLSSGRQIWINGQQISSIVES